MGRICFRTFNWNGNYNGDDNMDDIVLHDVCDGNGCMDCDGVGFIDERLEAELSKQLDPAAVLREVRESIISLYDTHRDGHYNLSTINEIIDAKIKELEE